MPVQNLPTCKQSLQVGRESCPTCGALPCDWVDDPWIEFPWMVTLAKSAGQRFLIDSRASKNTDMFSGFMVSGEGTVIDGRLNFHRTHFIEVLPS